MNGYELIAVERLRQVEEEGWTLEHDAKVHQYGDLRVIAATLAVEGTDATVEDACGWRGSFDPDAGNKHTSADPWGLVSKHAQDPIRRLVIAGALIAAEIDRISPVEAPAQEKKP